MKQLPVLLLFFVSSIIAMEKPWGTPPEQVGTVLWNQIKWQEVPPSEFSLVDRYLARARIVANLERIKTRIHKLSIASVKKEEIVDHFGQYIQRGTELHTAYFGSLPETDQIRHLDLFLNDYHEKENSIRQIVEALEQYAALQDVANVDNLLEQLTQLSMAPSVYEQFENMTLQ